jgi:hypothetical protein
MASPTWMPEIASYLDSCSASTNDSLCVQRSQRTCIVKVKIAPSRLSDILCHREQRYVGAQLSFHYDRKQIILERSDISENLGGQYIELYDSPTGRWRSDGNGCYFPTGLQQRPACQPHRHR